jgi:hypothetical protein
VRYYHRENELLWRVSCDSCKSMESPAKDIPSQPILDLWREVGRPEELHAKKGDIIPCVVQVEGKRFGGLG